MFVMDPTEAEVDAIRQKICSRLKNMTTEEKIDYYQAQAETLRREFNIRVSDLKPIEPVKVPDSVKAEYDTICRQIRSETEGMTYDEEEAYFKSERARQLFGSHIGVSKCPVVSTNHVEREYCFA